MRQMKTKESQAAREAAPCIRLARPKQDWRRFSKLIRAQDARSVAAE